MAVRTLATNLVVSAPTVSPSVNLVGNLAVNLGTITVNLPAGAYIRLVLEVSGDNFNNEIIQGAIYQVDHRIPFKTNEHTIYLGLAPFGGMRARLNVTDVIGTCTVVNVTVES